MDRQWYAADLRSACGTPQHLLLGLSEVLADANLADQTRAGIRAIAESSAIPGDRLRDLFDRHRLHLVGMRGLEIVAGAHHDMQAGASTDPLQCRGVTADPVVSRIDDCPPAMLDEMHQLVGSDVDVQEAAIVPIEERVHAELPEH